MDQRKVAIVTGSATGVGAATALGLAHRGYDVLINYSKSAHEASEAEAACREAGADTLVVQGDVRSFIDSVALLLASTPAEFLRRCQECESLLGRCILGAVERLPTNRPESTMTKHGRSNPSPEEVAAKDPACEPWRVLCVNDPGRPPSEEWLNIRKSRVIPHGKVR